MLAYRREVNVVLWCLSPYVRMVLVTLESDKTFLCLDSPCWINNQANPLIRALMINSSMHNLCVCVRVLWAHPHVFIRASDTHCRGVQGWGEGVPSSLHSLPAKSLSFACIWLVASTQGERRDGRSLSMWEDRHIEERGNRGEKRRPEEEEKGGTCSTSVLLWEGAAPPHAPPLNCDGSSPPPCCRRGRRSVKMKRWLVCVESVCWL